jgi:hypothetical protein
MQRWKFRSTAIRAIAFAACALAAAACSTGPVKRVSEPTASIQQLTVGADGAWSVELRLQNFSSVSMRFERVALSLRAGNETAGELRAEPGISIGPEAADTAVVKLVPSAAARLVIADALAERRSLDYSLEGTLTAAPQDRKPREFKVKRNSRLSPVPGLPGVMR